ncbi:Succinate-semialdehyde dehydrogenase, mitochondrial [Halocaridina rubra]|uniref:Succinate-semialdehyde dehydrogenase, mitochondrial n=1 Tax=Halocaridina rubra TaxID=373956 RepID=A0AAN8X8M4_HALRR
MSSIRVGAGYSCYEELLADIKKYEAVHNVKLVKANSKSVEVANRSVPPGKPLYPAKFKYSNIIFVCKHYGRVRTTGTGIRPNTKSYKLNCRMKITVSCNSSRSAMVIREMDETHNHDVSEEVHLLYPELKMDFLEDQGLRVASLLHQEAFIGGKWVTSASGKTFPVTNPANGKVIRHVPDMNEADVQTAIDAAHEAFQTWQRITAKERSILLRKWYTLMDEHKEDLALIITAEAGKPIAESRGEIAYGSSFLEWFAEEAVRIYGEVVQNPPPSKEMIFIRQPIGVVSLITPWNFPNAMITRKAGAALASGCTCIIKPSEDTPLSALAAVDLAEKAGIPPGVVNVVTASRANTAAVGNLLCTSPKIASVAFTGSSAVGKLLYKLCSPGIKKISLEVGGNAPFIIFNAADVKTAVEGLMIAKFRNAGQTCISANRIYVQSGIYDKFLTAFKETVKKRLVIGDGFIEDVNIGPIINERQIKKIDGIVNTSQKLGAEVLLGGKIYRSGELFYEPTILINVDESMPCFREEIFGPVAAIKKFETEEEILSLANISDQSLAGYIFTQDISQVWRVARRLETGMIGINESLISAAEAAFGGIKESRIGREGSRHGIDEYTNIKYLCIGGIT